MTQPALEGLQEASLASLTVVRIKRRRDDPAEPEIILEAAGDRRSKQPRYDDLLLQLHGMSLTGTGTAPAPEVRQRLFRRLRSVEVSVLEAMTESELRQYLTARSTAVATVPDATAPSPAAPASITTGPPAQQAAAPDAGPASGPVPQAAAAPSEQPKPKQGYTLGSGHAARSGGAPTMDAAQRRDLRQSGVTSQESRIATLRDSHRQAGSAARYKQIRRRREPAAGEGEEAASLLQMYDLERLPAQKDEAGAGAEAGRRAGGNGRRPDRGRQQRTQGHAEQERPQQSAEQARPRQPAEPAMAAAGPSAAAEEALILQHYGSLVSEYLQEHEQELQQHVRRIPARPRRAQQAAHAGQLPTGPEALECQQPSSQSAADAPSPTVLAPAGPLAAHALPAETAAAGATPAEQSSGAVPEAAVASGAGSGTAAPTSEAPRESGGGGSGSDGEQDAFVYDVYLPVPDEEMSVDPEGGDELWPWADAPSGPDLFPPIIEVGEDDDEFFWAGGLDADAAQRAAAAEEHDSEDSNAESYYANSYPDEAYAPYGGADTDDDGGDDESEMEEAEPPDADVGAGYSWGAALAMRRGGRPSDGDEEAEDDDEESFGRRQRRARPAKVVSSYYRTEDDDYSEHSSFLSEEEERREAEERRRRAICMH